VPILKKTLTITAYNRPQYLRQVLASVRKNATDGWELHFGVEPGNQEVLDLCNGVDFMPCTVTVNPTRLGVQENPFQTLTRVFDGEKSDLNVYLEDDVVLAVDALAMASWYAGVADPERQMALCLFNYDSRVNMRDRVCVTSTPSRPARASTFCSLGFAATAEQWARWIKPHWNDCGGWDYALSGPLNNRVAAVAVPLCSRSNHIGRMGGTFCSPRFHDRAFARLRWLPHVAQSTFVLDAGRPGDAVPAAVSPASNSVPANVVPVPPAKEITCESPLLSVLVCSMHKRAGLLRQLLKVLAPQCEGHPVEVLLDIDNGEASIGQKRQRLLERARGTFVASVDDDDLVSPTYVRDIIAAVRATPDATHCSLVGDYLVNGRKQGVFEHSNKYREWVTIGNRYLRPPNHLNAVRRDLAVQAGFTSVNFGEDKAFSMRLVELDLMKREAKVARPLYIYKFTPGHK